MKIKEIERKLSRSRQRLADWEALRSASTAPMVDMQIKWELDRIKSLQGRLFALHCNEQV
jgi:hypothetical protein